MSENKNLKNTKQSPGGVEKKLKDAEQREEALIRRITDKDMTITKMTEAFKEYEKVIVDLIKEKEQIKSQYESKLSQTKADRDLTNGHMHSLEVTFCDLHIKYEKSKEMTLKLKENEEVLMKEKKFLLESLKSQEQRYDKLKKHASQQLEIANQTLESIRKERALEQAKIKMSLKKEEITRASIQKQLHYKLIETHELSKLIEKLISDMA